MTSHLPTRKETKDQALTPASPAQKQQPAATGSPLSHAHILQLQKTIGNRAVMQLLAGSRTAAPAQPVVQKAPGAIADTATANEHVLTNMRASGVNNPFRGKTNVKFKTGSLPGTNELVGMEMEGIIGPDHPAGSEPAKDAHPKAYNYLSKTYPLNSFVRGHLLNGDLGGPGDAKNLYPITSQANSHHYQYVEKQVKEWVNDDYAYVYYKVSVDNSVGKDPLDADFDCEAYPVDDHLQASTGAKIQNTIESRATLGLSGATDQNAPASHLGNAMREPANNVGDIEFQSGKMGIGYKPIEDDKISDLKNAYFHIENSQIPNQLKRELLTGLGIGDTEWENVLNVVIGGETIPPNVSKANWNSIATRINKADIVTIQNNFSPEPQKAGGRIRTKKKFYDPSDPY